MTKGFIYQIHSGNSPALEFVSVNMRASLDSLIKKTKEIEGRESEVICRWRVRVKVDAK